MNPKQLLIHKTISDAVTAIDTISAVVPPNVAAGAAVSLAAIRSLLTQANWDRAAVLSAVTNISSVLKVLEPKIQDSDEANNLLYSIAILAQAANDPIIPPSYPPGPDLMAEAVGQTLAILDGLQKRLEGNAACGARYQPPL